MYTGFVHFQENEIANYDRTVAYLNGNPALDVLGMRPPGFIVSDCGCPAAMDCDFVSPRLDDAPWFDIGEAASEDFAGVLMVDIGGFDSTLVRTVVDNTTIGGSLSRQRAGPRTMLFDALLVANSCCGAEYGLRWLTEALRAGDCGTDCGLGELYMLKCCPPDGDTCHIEAPLTDFTDFTDQVRFTISVVATGSRTWQMTVVDSDRAGAVSTPGGAANNILGLLPTCLSALDSVAQFSIVPTPGSTFDILMIPSEGVTNIATAASGTGATAVIDFDLNLQDACDDVRRMADDLEVALCRWAGVYLGTSVSTLMLGQQRCWNVVDGYAASDYTRYMKRVGLADGPKVIDRFGTCCSDTCSSCQGTVLHVNWTMVSESPYIFSEVDWCMEDENFDKETDFCFDVSTLCEDCGEIGTQTITRERPRPTNGIQLRHDGTWCAQGWEPEDNCPPVDAKIGVTSTVVSAGAVTGEPAKSSFTDPRPARVNIGFDDGGISGTWAPSEWDPAVQFPPALTGWDVSSGNDAVCGATESFTQSCEDVGSCSFGVILDLVGGFGIFGTWIGSNGYSPQVHGFPPDCSLEVDYFDNGGGTEVNCVTDQFPAQIRLVFDPLDTTGPWQVEWISGTQLLSADCFEIVELCYPARCPIRLIYNECDGTTTWEAISPATDGFGIPESLEDCCLVVGDTVKITAPPDPETCPEDVVDCPINVLCDGTWELIDGVLDPCAPFPDPTCNYVVGTVENVAQELGPVEESVEIPSSIFVPDCGPSLILPPSQTQSLFDCYCEPWCSNRLCCTLNNMEQWSDATTFMTVYTGGAAMKNAKIQAFRNPFEDQGQTCPCDPADEFWRCRVPCAELQIPHLPAGAVLTVDSSIRSATVRFSNGIEQNALRYVQGPGGVPFDWFDVGHCSTLCIVVQADCSVAEDAAVSVGLLNRYLASGT